MHRAATVSYWVSPLWDFWRDQTPFHPPPFPPFWLPSIGMPWQTSLLLFCSNARHVCLGRACQLGSGLTKRVPEDTLIIAGVYVLSSWEPTPAYMSTCPEMVTYKGREAMDTWSRISIEWIQIKPQTTKTRQTIQLSNNRRVFEVKCLLSLHLCLVSGDRGYVVRRSWQPIMVGCSSTLHLFFAHLPKLIVNISW